MTVADLQRRTLQRLGDNPATGGYYGLQEVLNWINAAQRLMVLFSMCLESTRTLSLQPNTAYYNMLGLFPEWILPLRIRVDNGSKLKPARLSDLAALDATWNSSPGYPSRYALLGFDLLAIYQQPLGTAVTATITFARSPVTLFSPGDQPEVPAEYHSDLIDGATVLLRAKEGGQEWKKVLPQWDSFMDACSKLGDYVRARNKEQGYDRMPIEIKRFDRSKVLKEVAGAKQ